MMSRPCLMLVTAPMPGLAGVVEKAVLGGFDIVQVRDKTADDSRLLSCVREIVGRTGEAAKVVVNGSVQVGVEAGVYGVHLSEAAPREVYRMARAAGLSVGASVHSIDSALRARDLGAAYVIAGAVFETASHPGAQPQGVGFLESICDVLDIPALAIGGIGVDRVWDCLNAGAAGVAVVSSILHARDPERASREYRSMLDRWEG